MGDETAANDTEDLLTVNSETPEQATLKPSRLNFPNFHLVQLEDRELLKSREEANAILQQCAKNPSGEAQPVRLIVPLQEDIPINLSDLKTDRCLAEFKLNEIVVCFKRTSSQTNSFILLFLLNETRTDSEDLSPSADLIQNTRGDLIISPMHPLLSPSAVYRACILRASTSYEVCRLYRFINERLTGRSDQFGLPASVPEQGSLGLRLVLDIREQDTTNEHEWKPVPKEKVNVFKLRQKVAKRLLIGFTSNSGLDSVSIASCLNVSVTYGRFLQEHELLWLGPGLKERIGEAASALLPGTTLVTHLVWPCDSPDFQIFEKVTNKDECIFFTVAVQIVLTNVTRPLVLQRVCKARVFRSDELFWLMADRKPVAQDYTIHLSEFVDQDGTLFVGRFAEVVSVQPFSTPVNAAESPPQSGDVVTTEPEDEAEDENEPLVSGHGSVSQEISDDRILKEWGTVISEWQNKVKQNTVPYSNGTVATPVTDVNRLLNGTIGPSIHHLGSSHLSQRILRLVRTGIPDALRAEVWQLLSSCAVSESDLMDVYRILITKPCKYDEVIRRDLSRTFPAHYFFRDKVGQEYLFQVSRAYALYDEEVGYCQSLSFFTAVLLLHMPVEQAFSLLIQINNHYGLRELFLQDFHGLHMRLYQLQRLIQDQLPDVARHFEELHLETHMYASQWFLTLFTAKFPLNLVFRIVDLFLSEGLIFIFKVAFTLLRMARRDLLGLDFEGVLKHLRVTLPKRFVDLNAADELLSAAMSCKLPASKLLKYAKEWNALKDGEKIAESPVARLQLQVTALRQEVNRLERENAALASGLISSKTAMHDQVDKLEDKADTLTHELFIAKKDLQDALEENGHLMSELAQVKQMLRTTMEQATRNEAQHHSLVAAYRAVASDAIARGSSPETNRDSLFHMRLLWLLLTQVASCEPCSAAMENAVSEWKPADDGTSGAALDEYLAVNMPDVYTPIKDSNLSNEDNINSVPSSRAQPDDSFPLPAFRNLKPKQWLSNTLNALRSMKLSETKSNMDQELTFHDTPSADASSRPAAV